MFESPLLYRLGLVLDRILGDLQGLDHDVLGHLVRPGLDHGYGFLRPCDHEVQIALCDLGVSGVQDELAVERTSEAHGPDRAVKGQVGEGERRRSPYHANGVIRGVLVGDQNGAYYLYLVVIVLGEERPERPIREARGQDRPLRGPTLALDKAARDLTRRGHALLDVHAKG